MLTTAELPRLFHTGWYATSAGDKAMVTNAGPVLVGLVLIDKTLRSVVWDRKGMPVKSGVKVELNVNGEIRVDDATCLELARKAISDPGWGDKEPRVVPFKQGEITKPVQIRNKATDQFEWFYPADLVEGHGHKNEPGGLVNGRFYTFDELNKTHFMVVDLGNDHIVNTPFGKVSRDN